jgi:hypothetical protein
VATQRTNSAAATKTEGQGEYGSGAIRRIVVDFIPEEQMRAQGCGDWFRLHSTLHIRATLESAEAFGTEHAPFLVALHEMVEAYLCGAQGVSEASVDAHDALFEAERERGEHGEGAEPGDDPRASYRTQHRAAMILEHLMANFLGVTDYGEIR